MGIRVWRSWILILLMIVWGRLTCASEPTSCPTESATEAIFGFRDSNCPANGVTRSVRSNGVIAVRICFFFVFLPEGLIG